MIYNDAHYKLLWYAAMSHSLFDFPPELIPPQLQKIANDCGQQTALALLLNFPSVHIFIPASPIATHKLAELLGVDSFNKLCELYGGGNISVPRAARAYRSVRNQRILRDFANGVSQAVIALNVGLTERQVNTICNTVRIDGQLDIFN